MLVVEDEEHLRFTLAYNLRKAGYTVEVAATGSEALDRFRYAPIDLMLLDVMLPGISGFDVCRQIRVSSTIPILMLTARTDEIDTVVGLELGADDYIAKPFRLRELLARIAAALRRADLSHQRETPAAALIAADLILNPATFTITRANRSLMLKPRAFALLHFFMQHPGQVFTCEQLLQQLWGDPGNPMRLRTIRTVGYVFAG